MKQKAKLADDNSNQEIIDELLEIEAEISDQVAVKNRKKVVKILAPLPGMKVPLM